MSTLDGNLDFEAKQGERLVVAKILLTAAGAPADLTGLTVKFSVRQQGRSTPIVSRGACSIVGVATAGSVLYTGSVADTATPGLMEAEFVTLDGASVPQYFPDGKNTYLLGFITPAIA
jgi:hypothetical protein